MSVTVRALSGTATRHHKFAKRLGFQAIRSGATMTRIFDGYLFRALHAKGRVVVYVLDPPAVWVLTQYNNLGNDRGWFTRLGVRHLSRDQLFPLAAGDPEPPAPPAALAVTRAEGLAFVGVGRAQFGGDPLQYFFFQGQSDWRGNYASATAYLSDRSSTAPSPYRNVCIHSVATTPLLPVYPVDSAQPDALIREDAQLEFVWTEDGFRAMSGNSRFRFFPMAANWPSRALIVTAPRILEEGVNRYDEVIVCSTFLNQGPYSTNAELDQSDEYEHGFLVGRFRANRATGQGAYTVRNLWPEWCLLLRAGLNSDPDLLPVVNLENPAAYYRHGIVDVGIAESASTVIALASTARRAAEGLPEQADTYGTQLYRINRATGSYTVETVAKVSYAAADEAVTAKPLTLALNRLEYAVPDPLGGEPQPIEALAAVQFTATAEIDPVTIELVLFPTEGAKQTSGLGLAGYAPFWPKLKGAYSIWGHNENLGYTLAPQNQIVQAIGPGLLGVVAAPKAAVAGTAAIDWRLVVLDAQTLAFLEDRGTIDSLPSNAGVTVSLTVLVPEVPATAEDPGTPAVLAAWVASYQTDIKTLHRLSRDGGRTWHTIFTGVAGPIAYLGNQLHPVELGRTL